MRSKLLFTSLFLLAFMQLANAQYSRKKKSKFTRYERLQYTGGIGLTSYYGDLCTDFDCMQFRPNFGIGAIYRLQKTISARVDMNYFRLYSKDVYEERNLNFRSGNLELSVGGQFDLYGYSRHFRKRKKFQPYIYASVGLAYFNPHGQDLTTGKWVALRELKTEGQKVAYTPITVIIPYGAGIRYKWKPKYDFIFEVGYRKTFTDNLDDVSSRYYADPNSFADPVAQRMAMKSQEFSSSSSYGNTFYSIDENGVVSGQQRGNPSKKDGYFIFSFKVRYVVGAKKYVFKGKHPLLKPHHK